MNFFAPNKQNGVVLIHSPAWFLKIRLVFFLWIAHSFLMVDFGIADSCNFIINLVIFHAVFGARVPGVMWLCDKKPLLGAEIRWHICGPHTMRKT